MDPEVKKKLDTMLVTGEITPEQYKEKMMTISSVSVPEPSSPAASQAGPVLGGQNVSAPWAGDRAVRAGLHFNYQLFLFPVVVSYALSVFGQSLFINWEVAWTHIVPALFGVPGVVLYFIFLYKIWAWLNLADPASRHPSPGAIIGFMFIPFFNLYWQFVTTHGFVTRFNRFMQNKGASRLHLMPGWLGLTLPIMSVVLGPLSMLNWVGFHRHSLVFFFVVFTLQQTIRATYCAVLALFIYATGTQIRLSSTVLAGEVRHVN